MWVVRSFIAGVVYHIGYFRCMHTCTMPDDCVVIDWLFMKPRSCNKTVSKSFCCQMLCACTMYHTFRPGSYLNFISGVSEQRDPFLPPWLHPSSEVSLCGLSAILSACVWSDGYCHVCASVSSLTGIIGLCRNVKCRIISAVRSAMT